MYGLVLLYHIGLMTYQKLWPSVSSNYGNLRPQKGFHVTLECCGLISCDSVMLWPYATTNCGRFWLDIDYIRPPYGLDKWGSNIPIVTLSLQRNVCILRLKVSTVYIMFSLHKYISKLFFTTIFTLKALLRRIRHSLSCSYWDRYYQYTKMVFS